MDNILSCKCGNENLHLVAHLEFTDNDNYQATCVLINGKYPIQFFPEIKYQYRSQGNIHLLFQGECGHYNSKSFDGHKGNMILDENNLLDELCTYLDRQINEIYLEFNFKLLGEIEQFFMQRTKIK